jgi:NADP-dependent aldehyde dehydrogenase
VEARIEHAIPDRKPIPKPDLRMMMRPIGPVAVFCANNFPLAFSVAGGDTASALAGGNTVIVKAHRGHPGTAEMIGHAVIKAVRDSGLPEGTFSLINGPGSKVGIGLVKEPNIKAVGFTGSQSGGRALWDAAVSRSVPIPVYAEMSSINPVFILPLALAEDEAKIVEGLQTSVTLGVGQFCTKPGIVVLEQSDVTEHFISLFIQRMNKTPVGCMLTGDMLSAYTRSIVKKTRLSGVKLLALQEPDNGQHGFRAAAAVYLSDAQTFLENLELKNEVFGPTTHLVTYTTREELLSIARHFEGQLTATVHGTAEELPAYSELLGILEQKVGRLIMNGFPTGVYVCHAMVHGGPYPATTDGRSTSVGTYAIYRFVRPVSYQNFPDSFLPDELKEGNPLGIWRMVDGHLTKEPV